MFVIVLYCLSRWATRTCFFSCYHSYSTSVSLCAPFFYFGFSMLCLDYGEICNMLHCMSIIHVSFHFKPFLSHWWHINAKAKKKREENRKMCWAHREKQKKENTFSHVSIMDSFSIFCRCCCCYLKIETKKRKWRTRFYIKCALKCMPWHYMKIKRIYHENCRKCGTRIKYIHRKKTAPKE